MTTFKNGISRFTAEELAELAAFDAEIDAEDAPLTPAEKRQAAFVEDLLFPERAKKRAYNKSYYQRNAAQVKSYAEAHKAEIKERKHKWYLANRDRVRAQQSDYRARMAEVIDMNGVQGPLPAAT